MRPEKVELVATMEQKLQNARGILVADFAGMTVHVLSELRVRCRAQQIEFKVIKNTLARRAFREDLRAELDPYLAGPTALVISQNDEIVAAKVLTEFAKDTQKPRIKAGIVGGKVYGEAAMTELAKLPSKEILLGRLVGGLKSPIQNLHSALSSPLRNLATVLKQVSEKVPA